MANKKRHTTTTSISVSDPEVIETIKRAAELRGESVSKFILDAAGAQAQRTLKGTCPSCGRTMRSVGKKAA
jgi:uncharacterized protein (DUF1778 family)